MFLRLKRAAAVLFLVSVSLWAQNESGKFRLHKFEQPIGEETYSIAQDKDSLKLQSDFLFTDRGTQVPLKASWSGTSDYTPLSFETKGKSSRMSDIDVSVDVANGTASIRDGKESREQPTPKQFFTIAGYSPVAMQMALIRYWEKHGRPAKLTTFPSSEVEIKAGGTDSFDISGRSVKLQRYSIRGLVWGLQTVWMDDANRLAALVTRDAEFDHFEAVAEPYEAALPAFVANAAADEMAQLEEISKALPGRQTGPMAFIGATLIDGTGKAPIPNATIVTRDGKIVAAGPAASVKIPSDAKTIDVKGKYIIPGLWDMHAHYEQVEWGPIYLAAGVTTVRDLGNEFEFITAVRDRINSGKGVGPHMLLGGIVDGDSPMRVGITRVNSPQDAAEWVKKYHDAGFQQMKIYSSVTPENVKAICADAHKVGMTVTGHIPSGMTIYDGVNDGMDMVNHIQYLVFPLLPKGFNFGKATPLERFKALASVDIDSPEGRKLVEFLKEHGTVVDDTLVLHDLSMRPASEPATATEPGIAKVAPELREQYSGGGQPPDRVELAQQIMAAELKIIAALHKAGVPVVAGTDQAVPGHSLHRELELYVKAGFTPMEALQAATIVPARVMKQDKISGTVEAGKRADFDILDANPLDNISNTRTVRRVVSNGVLYETAPLWKSVGFQP